MKKTIKIITIFIMFFVLFTIQVKAETDTTKIKDVLTKYKNVDINSISNEELEKAYNEVLESYTAEEISNMVKKNKDKLEKQGISGDTIDKGAKFLKTTDDKAIKEMLKDTDVKQVITRIQKGESIESAIVKSQKDLNKTVASGVKVVLSSYIVKAIFITIGIYILYKIIIRGIIYQKAGKHFVFTFIPIYRDAVLFKICGYSPWIVLFLLLPVIGWIIYLIYKILMKFELAEVFGHKLGFGLGVWLLNPIFESIIAFSKNKYELE